MRDIASDTPHDSKADIAPFENAVNIPDANILNPVNKHAGIANTRHLHAKSKKSFDSPTEMKSTPAICL